MKKLDDTSQEIFNDMKGLGIDLNKISPTSINAFKKALNKSFDALTAGIKNPAPAPAPAPSQDDEDEDCDEMVDGVKTRAGLESQVKPTKFFP